MSVYKRNGKWWIGYRDGGTGKWIRRVAGETKAQAQDALAEERTGGRKIASEATVAEPPVRFEAFTETYIAASQRNQKRSWEHEARILNRLCREFGVLRLDEFTPMLIEDYKHRRSRELVPGTERRVTPRTVNYDLAVLKALFNMAIRQGKVATNPVRQVRLFKLNNERRRYLNQGEVQALVGVCEGRLAHLKPILVVALNTGMRMGEVLGLRWADLDFPNGYVHLRTSKNGKGRSIPLSGEAREAFQGLPTYRPKDLGSEVFVFSNGQGKPRISIRNAFLRALAKAGIKDFRFHDLRHTFASQLVSAGEDIMVIKELLGHQTLQMTLRYAHLHPDRGRRAVARLGELYGTKMALKP